jgi:leader peptidase (prepilin peptidase)/N-methyltransferase
MVTEVVIARPPQLLATPQRRWATAAAAAALAAAVIARYHGTTTGYVMAGTAAVLVVLAAIDLEQRRVPNQIVVPAAVVVLAARIALDPARAWVWAAAALGAAFAFFLLAILRPGGLGMGDVKLVLLIGAGLGGAVVPALLIGTVAGAVFAVVLLVRHGAEAGQRTIAYAPFLASGALVAILLLRP